MFKNYFKVAFRNLIRNKGFSTINISGLGVGMASAILIFLWIQNEMSIDQFHANRNRIYEVWNRSLYDNKISCWNTTPKVLAKTVQQDFPEVESVVRVNWRSGFLFAAGEKKITRLGNIVDSGFLQMFSFPLIKGNPKTALNDIYSIVLTEEFAKTLFGDEEPVGKIIRIENKDNFTVTGILEDLPNNTRFNFDYLIPWAYLRKTGGEDEYWGNNSTQTFVMLKPNASMASITTGLKNIRKKYDKEDPKGEMFLYPMSRWHLYSNFENGKEIEGRMVTVRLFGIIACFILLIACINFMNLSTARSEKRAKEVGIRKVVGAQKRMLIGQFIGESIIVAFIAGMLSLALVHLALPSFNMLTGKQLALDYANIKFWLTGIVFVFFTGIAAGSYPAFFLSSFQPVKVLKGSFRPVNAVLNPRKVLVVLQFTFAIILIISTIIIRQQIQYAQDRQTGYNKNGLIYHFLSGDLGKNYMLVKNELLSSGTATSVTKTSAPLTEGWSNTWGIEWQGKATGDRTIIDRFVADEALVTTAGMKLVRGRDFNLKEYPSDSTAVLINEASVKVMNFKDPVGQVIKDNGVDWHVVGVIRDFILGSPYQPISPIVIEGAKSDFVNIINIKLNSGRTTAQNLKSAEAIFRKYNTAYPFEYKFVDEAYAQKFHDEQRIGKLAALFASLSIFISCLGLFGLATHMAENRIKEIGVRKVLGASVASITKLLSKDFLRLVVFSIVIATPVAWWYMYKWLQNYPYHIKIQWWVFAGAGLLSVSIALLTVGYHAVKAAVANPVKSLRTE